MARPTRDVDSTTTSVASFDPVVSAGAWALVLGSMPGQRSLADAQYYAHPRNLFWPIMGTLVGAGPDLPYDERLATLRAEGIILWDVLARCERPGSLDASIVRASEVPNPIGPLLVAQPDVRVIACNGGAAHQLLRRHVLPGLDDAVRARVHVLALPSTSPANAAMPAEERLRAWSQLLDWRPR